MQGVAAELECWEHRLTEMLGEVALVPVGERAAVLSGVQGLRRVVDRVEAELLAVMRRDRRARDHLEGAPADVARRVRRAEVVDVLPVMSAGWADGGVPVVNVDAVASTLGRLNREQRARFARADEELASAAAVESVEVFTGRLAALEAAVTGVDRLDRVERLRQQRFHRIWKDEDECWNGRYRLAPDDGCRFHAAVQAEMVRLYAEGRDDRDLERASDVVRDHHGADALVNLTVNVGAGSVPAGMVVVTDPSLLEAPHLDEPDESDHGPWPGECRFPDGTPVPRETAARWLCDADLFVAQVGLRGEPLNLGRRARAATAAQRAVLAVLHPMCAVPGCTTGFAFCQIHHTRFWSHGGPTDLDTLIPVCARHHQLLHEGQWQLELHPDRSVTLTDPTGAPVAHAPPPDPGVLDGVSRQHRALREALQEAALARQRISDIGGG